MRAKNYIKDIGIPILFLGIVFFIGIYKLTESPPTWYDEGLLIQSARNIAEYGKQVIQLAPGEFTSTAFISSGYPLYWPVAIFFKFFGVSLFSARLAMVLFLLFFTLIFYKLTVALFGRRYAIFSALLLASFTPFYGNGKNVLGEVPGLLFLALFLFFILKSERGEFKNIRHLSIAAVSAGLVVATKPIFIMLLPAIFLGAVIFRKAGPTKKRFFWFLFIFSLPVIVWFLTQFMPVDDAAKILQFYTNPYGIAPEAMKSTIIGNFFRFMKEGTPVHFIIFFGIWAGRFLWLFKKDRRQISMAEGISFIFSAIILAAYLRTPGWYRYFFVAHILSFIYAPHSLIYILNNITRLGDRRTILKIAASFLLFAVSIFQFYRMGSGSWISRYYKSNDMKKIEIYFSNFPEAGKSIFLYNVPELVTFLKTKNYYQYMPFQPQVILGADQLNKIGATDYLAIGNHENPANFPLYKERVLLPGYIILEKL